MRMGKERIGQEGTAGILEWRGLMVERSEGVMPKYSEEWRESELESALHTTTRETALAGRQM